MKCAIPSDWVTNFSRCLYDWQGLEAGLLALIVAGLGVLFLQQQITQAQNHREDEVRRRHNAARLTLPLALSAVSELVQSISDEVAVEFEKFGPDGFGKAFDEIVHEGKPRANFNPITLPDGVIGSFEDFVASLSDPRDIRHVAELIGNIQILLSRYNGFDFKAAGVELSLVSLLIDAAKVKLLNEKIFNYARFVDDSSFGIVGVVATDDAWDQIHGRAESLVFKRQIPDIFFGDFKKLVQDAKKRGANPWIKKFEP